MSSISNVLELIKDGWREGLELPGRGLSCERALERASMLVELEPGLKFDYSV